MPSKDAGPASTPAVSSSSFSIFTGITWHIRVMVSTPVSCGTALRAYCLKPVTSKFYSHVMCSIWLVIAPTCMLGFSVFSWPCPSTACRNQHCKRSDHAVAIPKACVLNDLPSRQLQNLQPDLLINWSHVVESRVSLYLNKSCAARG